MRPGPQNKRMRGRNRGKGPNPLARVYESNGPDVKIRGTANHVADKYVTLARDAQASGDPVAAENYLQHAEHYFRIIAAAQAQIVPQHQSFFRDEPQRGAEEEAAGESDDELLVNGAPVPGLGPQPIVAPVAGREREGGREPYQQRENVPPRESFPARENLPPRDSYPNGNAGNGQASYAPESSAASQPEAPSEGGFAGDPGDREGFSRRRRRRRRPGGESFGQAQETREETPGPASEPEFTPEEA